MVETIWGRNDLLIFTTNGVVRKDGRLVMGKGIAKLVNEKFKTADGEPIDRYLGIRVLQKGNIPFIIPTDATRTYANKPFYLMSFPTKNDWREPSDISLIRESRKIAVKKLKDALSHWHFRDNIKRILCPLWGTGAGNLPFEIVREELKRFEEQVRELGFDVVFFSKEGIENIDKPTKFAIVGGRDFDDYEKMREFFLSVLEKEGVKLDEIHIISGGAKGADYLAQKLAREEGLPITIYYPDWKRSERAPLDRNDRIVISADVVVAFPTEKSRGTWYTVKKTRELGKKVYVFEGKLKNRVKP